MKTKVKWYKDLNCQEIRDLRDFLTERLEEEIKSLDVEDIFTYGYTTFNYHKDSFVETIYDEEDDRRLGEGINAIFMKVLIEDDDTEDFDKCVFLPAKKEALDIVIDILADARNKAEQAITPDDFEDVTDKTKEMNENGWMVKTLDGKRRLIEDIEGTRIPIFSKYGMRFLYDKIRQLNPNNALLITAYICGCRKVAYANGNRYFFK